MDGFYMPSFFAGAALSLTLLFIPSLFILNKSFKKYHMPYRLPYLPSLFAFWVFATITFAISGIEAAPWLFDALLALFVISILFWLFYKRKL